MSRDGEQFVLVYGKPGTGKTVAAASTYAQMGGFLIHCMAGVSQKSLLLQLAEEMKLTVSRYRTNGELLKQIVGHLAENPQWIFIDEATRLFQRQAVLDTIQVIHDEANVPVVMVGAVSQRSYVGVDYYVQEQPQISTRVNEWIEFELANLQDLNTIREYYTPEIHYDDELAERLLRESGGCFRRIRRQVRFLEEDSRTRRTRYLEGGMYPADKPIVQFGAA